MNSNPARALFEIFNRWEQTSGTATDVRALNTSEGVAETVAALRHLDAINSRLNLMEMQGHDVSVYRDAVCTWLQDLFHFNRSWHADRQETHETKLLRGLAIPIDMSLPGLTDMSADKLKAGVGDLLNQVVEALKVDEGLDAHLRAYLVDAVAHARACLDRFEASGVFDIARAIKDLEILVSAAQAMSREHASRWAKIRTAAQAFTQNPTVAAVMGAVSGPAATGLIEAS
jgi:hypothetical protein